MVWVGVVVNGASVIITIVSGIAIEYNGTDLISSILNWKFLHRQFQHYCDVIDLVQELQKFVLHLP
jgi:hypothetical protein